MPVECGAVMSTSPQHGCGSAGGVLEELEKAGRPQGAMGAPPSMRCRFKHSYHDRGNGSGHLNSSNLDKQNARDSTCTSTSP